MTVWWLPFVLLALALFGLGGLVAYAQRQRP